MKKFSHYAPHYVGCQYYFPGGEGKTRTLRHDNLMSNDFVIDKFTPLLKPLHTMPAKEKIKLFNEYLHGLKWHIEDPTRIEAVECFLKLDREYSPASIEIISMVDLQTTCAIIDNLRSKGYDCDGLIKQDIALDITKIKWHVSKEGAHTVYKSASPVDSKINIKTDGVFHGYGLNNSVT